MLDSAFFERDLMVLERRAEARPLVTVVLRLRRREADGLTEQIIESVLSQSLADLELAIVDDGSGDDLQELLGAYRRADDRVKLLRLARPCSLAAIALNAAIRRTEGRYLHYLFGREYLLPQSLEAMVAAAGTAEESLVFGACREVRREAGGREEIIGTSGHRGLPLSLAPARWTIPDCAVLHSRRLFESCGLFDPHLALRSDFGWDLWWRFSQRCQPRPLERDVTVAAASAAGDGRQGPLSRFALLRVSARRREVLRADRVARVAIAAPDLHGDEIDRLAFQAAIARPYLAAHLSAEEIVGQASAETAACDRLAIGIEINNSRNPSLRILYDHFADRFPEWIQLDAPKQFDSPALPGEGNDLLVQFRTLADPRDSRFLAMRRHRKPVVYALDDDLFHAHQALEAHSEAALAQGDERAAAIGRLVQDADFVIASTKPLARQVEAFNPRVGLLRTNVPQAWLPPVLDAPVRRGKLTFAIVGQQFRAQAMQALRDDLLAFFAEAGDSAHLVIYSSAASKVHFDSILKGVSYEIREKRSYDTYFSEIRESGFDFIINPLLDYHVFFESKSPVKYLEATVAGAILITSDVVSYRAVEHGRTAIKVAPRPGAWLAALRYARSLSAEERAAMLARARAQVLREFSTEALFPTFLAVHSAAILHAALGSRSSEGGRARILLEGGGARVAELLSDLHFDVVAPPRQFAAAPGGGASECGASGGWPAAVIEERARWLRQAGIALVHAASPGSAWVGAARRLGLACAADYDGARPLAPAWLWSPEQRPGLVVGRAPSACRQAASAGFRAVLQLMAPDPTAAAVGPVERPLAARAQVSLRAEPGGAEWAAALAAKALLLTEAQGFALGLRLPCTAEEGERWRRRWPRLLGRGRIAFAPGAAADDPGPGPGPGPGGVPGGVPELEAVLVFGDGSRAIEAALEAMARGKLVVAVQSADVAELVCDGVNGFVVATPAARPLAEALVSILSLPPSRLAQIRSQALATAGLWAQRDRAAGWLLRLYRLAAEEARARLAQRLEAEAAPGRLRDLEVSIGRGQPVDFLGFRSSDATGPLVQHYALPPDWRLEEVEGSCRVTAGGLAGGRARFAVAGSGLEIGFRAGKEGAQVALTVDGAAALFPVVQEAWVGLDFAPSAAASPPPSRPQRRGEGQE